MVGISIFSDFDAANPPGMLTILSAVSSFLEENRVSVRSCVKTKEVLFLSFVVTAAILVSTTVHEFLHFAVARAMEIPAQFLNMTAVGIPSSNVDQYSAFHLLLMNGLAPLFSILALGGLGFLYSIRRSSQKHLLRYFIAWIALLNLPYLGLQMLLVASRARFNGTGNDFAAIAGYFGVPIETRAVLSVFGYVCFLSLLYPLRVVIRAPTNQSSEGPSAFKSSLKRILGVSLFGVSFGAVCVGNWMLVDDIPSGIFAIVFGGLMPAGLGFATLIPWATKWVKHISMNWILPGVLGSLFLLPLGIIDGNDYAIIWLIVVDIILGSTFFASISPTARPLFSES